VYRPGNLHRPPGSVSANHGRPIPTSLSTSPGITHDIAQPSTASCGRWPRLSRPGYPLLALSTDVLDAQPPVPSLQQLTTSKLPVARAPPDHLPIPGVSSRGSTVSTTTTYTTTTRVRDPSSSSSFTSTSPCLQQFANTKLTADGARAPSYQLESGGEVNRPLPSTITTTTTSTGVRDPLPFPPPPNHCLLHPHRPQLLG